MTFHATGVSTDDVRTETLISGLNECYPKHVSSILSAGHQGKLTAVYQDAIELNGGSLIAVGGIYTTFGLLVGIVTTYLAWPYYGEAWSVRHELPWIGYVLMAIFAALVPWCFFLVGAFTELFSPSELPVYLDRARRKVYYVHQGRKRFFLFGPSLVEARSVDWDLVDCELRSSLGGAGLNTIHRTYTLVFLVRKSVTDPTIVDSFELDGFDVGSALWQYMVRYMDGGDAPLQSSEKAPALKGEPIDLWETIKTNKLASYWRDWRVKPWGQFWWTLFLPLNALVLLVNRFVVWTAQKVTWPQEIKDALGPQMTDEDVANDTEHRLRAADPSAPATSRKPGKRSPVPPGARP